MTLKPIIYGSNGVADNDSGSVQGSPGLIEALRAAADPTNPKRPVKVLHVGSAALVLPEPKQIHLGITVMRLHAARFEVVNVDLEEPDIRHRLLQPDYDILYLNGGYPPQARKLFETSQLWYDLPRIREHAVVATFSASAMALGTGSLFLSQTIKEARHLHAHYEPRFWRGCGHIRRFVIPHAPLTFNTCGIAAIGDGKFFIQEG